MKTIMELALALADEDVCFDIEDNDEYGCDIIIEYDDIPYIKAYEENGDFFIDNLETNEHFQHLDYPTAFHMMAAMGTMMEIEEVM